jgi:hypothetical protein
MKGGCDTHTGVLAL